MRTVESTALDACLDLDALKAVFQDHPVRLAILFGSHATQTTHAISDLDIAVEFDAHHPSDSNYNEVFLGLSADLSESHETDDIDLVDLHTVSPALAAAIFENGVLLVGDYEHATELRRQLTAAESEQPPPRERLDSALARIDAHLDDNDTRVPISANGDLIHDFLSVAALLEEPELARLYTFLSREGEATLQEVIDNLEFAEETASTYLNRLVDAGVIQVTCDEQPRRYAAREIKLTVTAPTSDHEYTITPALIDAVGRQQIDDDIDTYVNHYGVAGLARALAYAVAREQGEVTHRLMAQDLDISPLVAETILQALWPSVHRYFDIEDTGESVTDSDVSDAVEADVDLVEFHESTRTANDRFGSEDIDDWAPHAVDDQGN